MLWICQCVGWDHYTPENTFDSPARADNSRCIHSGCFGGARPAILWGEAKFSIYARQCPTTSGNTDQRLFSRGWYTPAIMASSIPRLKSIENVWAALRDALKHHPFCSPGQTMGWYWCLPICLFDEKANTLSYWCKWWPYQILIKIHVTLPMSILIFPTNVLCYPELV